MAAPEPGKSQNANRSNMYGSSPKDPDHATLSFAENYFLTEDSTATPVTSPVTVSNSANTVLTVPEGAVTLRIYCSTACRINDASPASAPYFVIPATTVMDIPCASPTNSPATNSGLFYLRGDAASSTVQFMFLCV